MPKPELDIIHSTEAETFLRSVTKGFYNQSFIGLWIYEVIGREWDELRKWSDGMHTEIHPQTCTWSIAVWEWVYGFEPDESLTLEERRRRILSKVFSIRPINLEALRRGISAVSGAEAEVKDFVAPYRFSVMLNTTDNPIPMEHILRYICETKPAHLSVASVKVMFPIIENTLHIGGGAGVDSTLGQGEQEDAFDFIGGLHMGGWFGALGELPQPEGQGHPGAASFMRVGGVCTIISNLSMGD